MVSLRPQQQRRGPDRERLALDAAATTPLSAAVLEAMRPHLGLPGGAAGEAIAAPARARVAEQLGCALDRLLLTSGGTEANLLALRVALAARPQRSPARVITQPTEHPSVLAPLRALEGSGALRVTWLPVDGQGRVDPDALSEALREEAALVSVMLANHETGVVQPIGPLSASCRAAGALLHVDAVQAARSLDVSLRTWGADLLTISGHKLNGPKGVGALALSDRLGGVSRPRPLGTPSVAAVEGLATALESPDRRSAPLQAALAASRDALQREVQEAVPQVVLNGGEAERLPGHLNLSVPGVSGEALVVALDRAGIDASSGSACASGQDAPSPVLLAMGRPSSAARGSLRLTLGMPLTAREVERTVGAIAAAVGRLRALTGEP